MPALGQAQGVGDLLQQVRGAGSGSLGGLLSGNSGSSGSTGGEGASSQSQTLQPQQIPAVARQLPPSRLEQIISARAGMRLRQFGYDQLGSGLPVTVLESGAVQDDYILGPGDEITVSLRGQENSEARALVDRNGRVVLPRISPIPATGRAFGDFRQDVDAAVRRAYVATTASVAIGRVRQINVLVTGEVNAPGPRIVTGLSSVVDAVLLSGGIRKTGSLRNLRIQRGGREYTVDLYSVLTGSGRGANLRLADGDRVIVPPLGPTVTAAGLLRRPGIYELPARATGMTARALLALAGGQEVRGRFRLAVQRIAADGSLNLVTLENDKEIVRDSEILRVEMGADRAGTQATLSGGLGLAGQYAVANGARLSDIIRAPGALGDSPYTLFGIIVRKDQRTLMRTLLPFTPVAVLAGTENQQLQSDDIIRPISVDEEQLLSFVVKTYLDKLALDQQRIRNPLATNRAQAIATAQSNSPNSALGGSGSNATSPASIAAAQAAVASAVSPSNPFGLTPDEAAANGLDVEDFSAVPADVQRNNIIALLNIAAPGTMNALLRQQAYQQALITANGAGNTGQTTIQSAQAQQAALIASQTGNALQAPPTVGAYGAAAPVQQQQQSAGNNQDGSSGDDQSSQQDQNGTNKRQQSIAPNFQEQTVHQGDYATNREAHTFGELSRQLNVDPLVLVNFLIDHRARLDGAVRGPGTYLVGPNVTLNDLVQAAGGTLSWADESGIELLTTAVDNRSGRAATQRQTLPLRQGTLASYVVRPRDQLHFNKIFTDVGAGSITIQGEARFTGNYPIRRGEHLSELLMRAGGLTNTAYPQGAVFLRKSAAKIEEQGYNRAADEIQSQLLAGIARIGSDKITGEGYTAIQGFINQLRTQKGLGRIAISADPSVLAANPQQDPLLEPGDVLFIPQRPSTITVLGEVMQPGSYGYRPGLTVGDYVKRAGGYGQFSDEDLTFIVLPDGSAKRMETSWLSFDAQSLPPGSSIVVPRDLAPLTARQILLDVTGILSSFAVTAASLAILAKQ